MKREAVEIKSIAFYLKKMYLSEKKDSLAMIQKILIGILTGIFIGIVITSIFATRGTSLIDLFLTQITATSIVTGIL